MEEITEDADEEKRKQRQAQMLETLTNDVKAMLRQVGLRPTRQRISLSVADSTARGFSTANALSVGFRRATRSVTACRTSTGLSMRRA